MKFDLDRHGLFRNGELTFQESLPMKNEDTTLNSEVHKNINDEKRNTKQLQYYVFTILYYRSSKYC